MDMGAVFYILFAYLIHNAAAHRHYQLCANNTQITRSCSTQIWGDYSDHESCKVEYISPNSTECISKFGPISHNAQIGGVNLRPYILPITHMDNRTFYSVNYTVLNITFNNIKWKTMKFRFQKYNDGESQSHCRNIVISNDVTINEESVMYYDCYWSVTDGNYNGQSHILDYEATDDFVVNRGRYYFNIPTGQMLSPSITEKDWKPFVYTEILTSTMKLHIMPPPSQLKITAYQVETMRECDKGTTCEEIVKNTTIKLKNNTNEVTYEYSLLGSSGSYYFVVTPLHDMCKSSEVKCQAVESPRIIIDNDVHQTLNICMASVTALVVTSLFAYYVVLRVIRRYWCRDYRLTTSNDIPPPTKVLIIYSPANRHHAKCVASFVTYLRSEYGLDVMYDGDISNTTHKDPHIWAAEAFTLASHVLYIVGPADTNQFYDNSITAHRNVDIMLLSFVKATRACQSKEIVNVFFEYSSGQVPIETRHSKTFFLLKDLQKLIAFLSKNLLPKKVLMRTEKGRCFYDDLKSAKKLLSGKEDVVVACEKSSIEKKVLL